jgi:DNA repair exonuclease SbcCD nuclease subunit
MTLVAIITDTHFNFKRGNKIFHEYFEKFYKNVFFPTLKKLNIDTVIHMGDIFDNRRATDYWSIEWTKKVILEPLKDYNVHLTVGNHDIFYKNTTNLNSPILLMDGYDNINIYTKPQTVNVDGTDILFLPWITPDGEQDALNAIKETPARVSMGHLELNDFYPQRGHPQVNGRDKNLFSKFDRVFSGHYHTRSDDGKIFYVGNPYELYWSDYNDKRGFAIFDTETYELKYIDNPYKMFRVINYVDDAMYDLQDYENCMVKLIVKEKRDKVKYEKFLDFLLEQNLQDLKIIEEVVVNENFDAEEEVKNEDTLSLLKRYVDESEVGLNKSRIKEILTSIYQESFQLA